MKPITKITTAMASIKKRKDTWYAVFYLNGKSVTKTTSIKVADDKKGIAARQKAEVLENEAKNPSIKKKVIPTVRAFLESYEPYGKESNVKNHQCAAKKFLQHLGLKAEITLDALNVSDCTDFFLWESKRVSYGTLRQYKVLLHAQFEQAIREDIIQRNPFSYVQLHRLVPKNQQRKMERQAFTPEECRYIINNFPEPWGDLFAVSFFSGGQRLGDVCNLLWSQVNFERKTISYDTAKTGKLLTHPMTDALEAILRRLYDASDKRTKHVFPSAQNAYSRGKGIASTMFTNLLRAHGIISAIPKKTKTGKAFSEKSFHSIRHTVVTMLRDSGNVSADLCREIVGHDSEDVERAYYHPTHEAKAAAISILEQSILP